MGSRRDIIARSPGLSAPALHLNSGSARIPERADAFRLRAADFYRTSNDMPRRLLDIPHRDDDTRPCVNHLPRPASDFSRWSRDFVRAVSHFALPAADFASLPSHFPSVPHDWDVRATDLHHRAFDFLVRTPDLSCPASDFPSRASTNLRRHRAALGSQASITRCKRCCRDIDVCARRGHIRRRQDECPGTRWSCPTAAVHARRLNRVLPAPPRRLTDRSLPSIRTTQRPGDPTRCGAGARLRAGAAELLDSRASVHLTGSSVIAGVGEPPPPRTADRRPVSWPTRLRAPTSIVHVPTSTIDARTSRYSRAASAHSLHRAAHACAKFSNACVARPAPLFHGQTSRSTCRRKLTSISTPTRRSPISTRESSP